MKVFLTGATGGIGSFVAEALLQKGFQVAALVRQSSVEALKNTESFQRIQGDLTEISLIEDDFARFKPDIIIHLGWVGVDQKEKNNATQMSNLKAAVDLLRLAKTHGVKTFIGMGSESEYGVQNRKLSEAAQTLPLTNYAVAKLATGLLCEKICHDSKINFVWLRLFSSYGPRDRAGSLMSLLIKSLLSHQSMPLSRCEQVWDYTFVKDIARLFAMIAQDPKEGGFFNLGGGQACQLKDVVLKIADIIGEGKELLDFGARAYAPNQMMHLEADISKLQKVYGWSPKVSLEQGLTETIAYNKGLVGSPS